MYGHCTLHPVVPLFSCKELISAELLCRVVTIRTSFCGLPFCALRFCISFVLFIIPIPHPLGVSVCELVRERNRSIQGSLLKDIL